MTDLLFNEFDMSTDILAYPREMSATIREWDDNRILSVPEEDLVQALVRKFALDVPVLKSDEVEIIDDGETQIARGRDYGFRGGPLRGEFVKIAIPFTGDRDLFRWRPSTYSMNPPRAEVGPTSLSIVISAVKLAQHEIKGTVERTIASIESYLSTMRTQAAEWTSRAPALAREMIQGRKKELLERKNLVASLGLSHEGTSRPGWDIGRTDASKGPQTSVARGTSGSIQARAGVKRRSIQRYHGNRRPFCHQYGAQPGRL